MHPTLLDCDGNPSHFTFSYGSLSPIPLHFYSNCSKIKAGMTK